MPTPHLERLIDHFRELEESPGNHARFAPWAVAEGHPARSAFSPFYPVFPTPHRAGGRIPFTFDLEPAFWHRILDIDLARFYSEPAAYLEGCLRIAIYQYEHFETDLPLTKSVHIDFGSVFLASLMGVQVVHIPGEPPWMSNQAVWSSEAEFAHARFPDFDSSGLAPLAHRFYGEIRELAGDDFTVGYPLWRKGPFALLTHLRGYSQLLLDIYDRPQLVHQMMAFVVEAMKKWCEQRRRFTGETQYSVIWLGNDEVGTPTVSPAAYEEFILPYETEISRFFGGIDYWHSCGNTTALLGHLARLPNLHMLDIGPWTDLAVAVRILKSTAHTVGSIMRRINPIEAVIMADEDQMRQPLEEVRRLCAGVLPTMVQYNGLNYVTDWREGLCKVQTLQRACRQILSFPSISPVPH